MATAEARIRQQRDPRPVAFRGKDGAPRWHPVFINNPRISRTFANAQISENRSGNRPYIRSFDAERFTWVERHDCQPGEFYFSAEESRWGERNRWLSIIEPNVKNPKANKAWPWERWQALVDMTPWIDWVQLGPANTRRLNNTRLLVTPDFRVAAAVLQTARVLVTTEGGLHHAAAAVGLRAVVIFGGFISPAQTGYDFHRNIFTGGQPCGLRARCSHCTDAMARITPGMVMEELGKIT